MKEMQTGGIISATFLIHSIGGDLMTRLSLECKNRMFLRRHTEKKIRLEMHVVYSTKNQKI